MITILMPYYENKGMLLTQLQYWFDYSEKLLDRIQLIIVDDGSQKFLADRVLRFHSYPDFKDIRVYRVQEDKPWNHMGARNLGFSVADKDWILSTDMDQVIPQQSMENLLNLKLVRGHFYRPTRFYKGQLYKRHNDTYILHRDDFWQVGGYDEDFSGYYGGGSTLFYWQLKNELNEVLLDENVYTLHYEGLVEDSSTDKWGRQDSEYYYKNSVKMQNVFRLKNKSGEKPKNLLRFKWERVM